MGNVTYSGPGFSTSAAWTSAWQFVGLWVGNETGVTQTVYGRGEFRPRQTRQLPRAVNLKGRLLSCQS